MTDQQPTDGGPELSPEVARDIQRDALALARSDAWLNIAIAVGMAAATAFVAVSMLAFGRNQLRERNYSMVIQFAVIDVVALFAAIRSWRRYRQLRLAVATDTIAPAEDVVPAPRPPQGHLFMMGSRPIILLLVLASLGLQWQSRRRAVSGPIVFRNATITTGTGFIQQNMTVAVANGQIVYVGDGRQMPIMTGARQFDARAALVSAATFDHSARSPLEGLRHVWAGQVVEGAPGDLVITTASYGRGRSRVPDPKGVIAAVVNGRYYSADELTKPR